MLRQMATLALVLAGVPWHGTPSASASQQNQEQAQPAHHFSAPAARFQERIDFVRKNGALAKPSSQPTEFPDADGNAWFAEGGVKLPAAVEKLTYNTTPGTIVANAVIDFDQLAASKRSANPLLALFTGKHDVVVKATASGEKGKAQVHVESASLDGTTLPRSALEFLVDHYVKPKYPNVGLDTEFAMPDRVDTATVGTGKVVLVQK